MYIKKVSTQNKISRYRKSSQSIIDYYSTTVISQKCIAVINYITWLKVQLFQKLKGMNTISLKLQPLSVTTI